MKTKTTDVAGKCSHLKIYTFDINEETYKIKIKKTLVIDQIDSSESGDQRSFPHSPPSLMGRVTYQHAPFGAQGEAHDKLLHFDSLVFSKLKFDFAIETIPGQNAEIIDLVPCFNSSVIRVAQARRAVHLSPNITEAIKTCIKNYYHEFLSTLK